MGRILESGLKESEKKCPGKVNRKNTFLVLHLLVPHACSVFVSSDLFCFTCFVKSLNLSIIFKIQGLCRYLELRIILPQHHAYPHLVDYYCHS